MPSELEDKGQKRPSAGQAALRTVLGSCMGDLIGKGPSVGRHDLMAAQRKAHAKPNTARSARPAR